MSTAAIIVQKLLEGDNEDAKTDLMAQPDPVIFDHWELYFNELNAEGEYDDSGMSIFFRTYAGSRPFPEGHQVDLSSKLGLHLYRLAIRPPDLAAYYADRIGEVAYLLCISQGDFDSATRYDNEADTAPRGPSNPPA